MAGDQTIYEGRTATSKDGKSRVVFRSGMWVKDTSFVPPQPTATTTNADLQVLNQANATAAAERESVPTYLQASQAIQDLGGTGPWKEWLMSAGAPGQSEEGPKRGIVGDAFGAVSGVLSSVAGAAARPFYSSKQLAARDRLRTIAAQGALSKAGQLKGAASDRDIALVRTAGLDPSKVTEENNRVVLDGIKQSGLSQTRAMVASRWIADYGSLSAKNANGLTYPEALGRAEARYAQNFAERQAARALGPRRLPAPPPGRRGGQSIQTIDLDGNIIR